MFEDENPKYVATVLYFFLFCIQAECWCGDDNQFGNKHNQGAPSEKCSYTPSNTEDDTTAFRFRGGSFAMSVFGGIGKKLFFMFFKKLAFRKHFFLDSGTKNFKVSQHGIYQTASGDNATDTPPPSVDFWEKQGGVSVKKFYFGFPK